MTELELEGWVLAVVVESSVFVCVELGFDFSGSAAAAFIGSIHGRREGCLLVVCGSGDKWWKEESWDKVAEKAMRALRVICLLNGDKTWCHLNWEGEVISIFLKLVII